MTDDTNFDVATWKVGHVEIVGMVTTVERWALIRHLNLSEGESMRSIPQLRDNQRSTGANGRHRTMHRETNERSRRCRSEPYEDWRFATVGPACTRVLTGTSLPWKS